MVIAHRLSTVQNADQVRRGDWVGEMERALPTSPSSMMVPGACMVCHVPHPRAPPLADCGARCRPGGGAGHACAAAGAARRALRGPGQRAGADAAEDAGVTESHALGTCCSPAVTRCGIPRSGDQADVPSMRRTNAVAGAADGWQRMSRTAVTSRRPRKSVVCIRKASISMSASALRRQGRRLRVAGGERAVGLKSTLLMVGEMRIKHTPLDGKAREDDRLSMGALRSYTKQLPPPQPPSHRDPTATMESEDPNQEIAAAPAAAPATGADDSNPPATDPAPPGEKLPPPAF